MGAQIDPRPRGGWCTKTLDITYTLNINISCILNIKMHKFMVNLLLFTINQDLSIDIYDKSFIIVIVN